MKKIKNIHSIKKIGITIFCSIFFITVLVSCDNSTDEIENPVDNSKAEIVVKTSEIINANYIGNGVQWDPYPQAYKFWNQPISEQDWETLYNRLNVMKPSFVRVVYDAYDKYADGNEDAYNPERFIEGLEKVLQYCQDNNITVMLGNWGYGQVNPNNGGSIFENRIENAAKYLDFLVNTKGFTCIKYYNTVNEPNLGGSATEGNYELWKNTTLFFYDKMLERNLESKVKLAGPDIAVFNLSTDIQWITKSVNDFGNKIGIYDIHTYPSKGSMFSGEYENVLKTVKDNIPTGTEIIIGEFGFKYETGNSNLDKELANENSNNINSNPNIAKDSNTLVKTFEHGVDIISLTMKIVNAGYSGSINWGLDDAMHSGTTSGTDLKTWGFWNILGNELFNNPDDENLRPHFYTYSLLTRYMQNGTKVFKVDVPRRTGLDAIAVEKDGKYMIAINNIHKDDYEIMLSIDNLAELNELKQFLFKKENRKQDANGYPLPEKENMSFKSGEKLTIAGQTLVLLTNMD